MEKTGRDADCRRDSSFIGSGGSSPRPSGIGPGNFAPSGDRVGSQATGLPERAPGPRQRDSGAGNGRSPAFTEASRSSGAPPVAVPASPSQAPGEGGISFSGPILPLRRGTGPSGSFFDPGKRRRFPSGSGLLTRRDGFPRPGHRPPLPVGRGPFPKRDPPSHGASRPEGGTCLFGPPPGLFNGRGHPEGARPGPVGSRPNPLEDSRSPEP